MPRSQSRNAAPRIDDLDLGELAEGDPGTDLVRGADLESVRYAAHASDHLDLRDARLSAVELAGVTADELDLRGARLLEVDARQIGFPVVRAARSHWRDARLSGRLGSVDAYESEWRSVHFTGCKLSYLNLRGADVADLLFTDCLIEELDLLGAQATRVRFERTRVDHLRVQEARLQELDLRGADLETIDSPTDLRGATLTSEQLLRLAPLLAARLGIRVEDRAG